MESRSAQIQKKNDFFAGQRICGMSVRITRQAWTNPRLLKHGCPVAQSRVRFSREQGFERQPNHGSNPSRAARATWQKPRDT
jgi:hypothetical protein